MARLLSHCRAILVIAAQKEQSFIDVMQQEPLRRKGLAVGLLKIHEAINTWIVSDRIDERMRKFDRLPKISQDMVLSMIDRLYKDELAKLSENVVHLKAVNE